ncbi:MAG: PAC2 family protein [Candidatus Omnitrophica bacterium]|nr:PAC2 family protein [Candidatus Omnitrophota bacterium]MDD5552424.1 PAC2 family protein [Candidatus Omnitrophota bacterium]
MEGVKILKRPRLKSPYLICAWPGMGEVAFRAATYLVEQLKAEEFAQIPPEDFFYMTGSIVQGGILQVPQLPYSKFYFWKNKSGSNDLIIFISNAQPDLARAEEYSGRILSMAKHFKVKNIASFAAMPQPIDHTQQPRVWVSATKKEILEALGKYNLERLQDGQVSGMNGLFLGIARQEGFSGFCLLGEIPLYTIQIENPKASYAVLEALSKILKIQFDLHGLIDEAHGMEGEINKLMDYLKLGAPSQGPIGEDDIEKIKKSLTMLTKLPLSVKENIERLFTQSKADISRAKELKSELDKWNVYKEYEDRFLDLFKKKKEGNN